MWTTARVPEEPALFASARCSAGTGARCLPTLARAAPAARGHATSADGNARPQARHSRRELSQSVDSACQAGGSPSVVAFLKGCGLQMYAAQLLQHGFDEMDTLHEIEDADVRELGIPAYHAARLQRALQELRPSQDFNSEEGGPNPVLAFLEEHGLEQYSAALLGSGFDEMETLLEVDDADLRDLGLPRGHALKLKRHLREYATEAHDEGQQLVQAAGMTRNTHLSAPRVTPKTAPCLEATETMRGDVAQSWERIQNMGTKVVGERIYKSFFRTVPEAMDSFPLDVRLRYQELFVGPEEEGNLENSAALRNLFSKVLSAIGCTVAGLHESEKLVPLLSSLGARHIGYRVSENFWPALGKAINITLRDLLGDSFTPEVASAWTVVYGFMSQIMIEGLRQAQEASRQMITSPDDEDVHVEADKVQEHIRRLISGTTAATDIDATSVRM